MPKMGSSRRVRRSNSISCFGIGHVKMEVVIMPSFVTQMLKSLKCLKIVHTLHLKGWFIKKMNMKCHLPGWGHSGPIQASFRTYWKIDETAFLEMSANMHTAHSAQIWQIFLPVFNRPSKKAVLSIFQYVRDEAWMAGSRMTPGRWHFMFIFLLNHSFKWSVSLKVKWS